MKEVTTTNLNAILTEGTCFFTFPQSSTNAPTVEPGGGLQIDLTDKFVQFVTTFPSSSKAGPSFIALLILVQLLPFPLGFALRKTAISGRTSILNNN